MKGLIKLIHQIMSLNRCVCTTTLPKKQSGKNLEKRKGKKQNQENLQKLSQCRLQMGLPPHPHFFSKSAPPQN